MGERQLVARQAVGRQAVGRQAVARQAVGRYGEDVAVAHLEAAGFQVLARNWHHRYGEIDIVALDDGCLVVCEVKTRRSLRTGSPLEAVTPAKLARLRRLTGLWLAAQERSFSGVRIDVVGVLRPRTGPAVVEHLRAVG